MVLNKFVVLLNLGGVKKPSDIPVFLFNMFNDKNILPVKQPFRIFLSFLITLLRAKGTYSILKNVKSPVFDIGLMQAKKLQYVLKTDVKAQFIYSKPFVKDGACVYVPLYSFYSHTTYGNILRKFSNVTPPFCIFGEFFDIMESKIKEALDKVPNGLRQETTVLLSAHSLPVNLAEKTKDPYKNDLEVFAKYLKKRLAIPLFLSFQSKLGPVKWFEPSTEDTIKKLSKQYRALILVPVSFVNDNTETVYEQDIVYKKLAHRCSFEYFDRVNCLNDDDNFTELLSEIVQKRCK